MFAEPVLGYVQAPYRNPKPYREAMRPKISYETKRRVEQLVNDIEEPVYDLDTEDQIRVLIQLVVEEEYGHGPHQKTVPPWERDPPWKRERKRKRKQKERDRRMGRI
jgi:hypothetical protein